MTTDMWLALAILAVSILLFITEWLRVDIVALGVVVALMISGLLTTQEALAGFSNSAVLTIAALFIVGGAALHTGLARMMGDRILAIAGSDHTRLTVVIMLAVALMSSIMSDTGVVAVMLPAIISLTDTTDTPPSRLLIPLAFGALLGGSSTLIGTPPNIIVTDLLREEGLRAFSFFSFTPMGLLLIIAGVGFMALVGRRLLPDRRVKRDVQPTEAPQALIDHYRLPDNLYRLRVRRKSPLVTQTVVSAAVGERFDINVLEIIRKPTPQPVARLGDQRLVLQSDAPQRLPPGHDTALAADDVLIVRGDGDQVAAAAAYWDLGIQPAEPADQEALITDEVGIAEVVLPPRSALIGKTLPGVRFGSTYHLTVLDIRRPGVDGPLSLKETALGFGDTLLVQGEWRDIAALRRRRRDFVVIGEPEAMAGPANRRKAPIALAVLVGMVALIVTGVVSVATASMLASLMMVLTGCLSMDEAYEAVDWKSIVLIAGMLPMATALEKVGLVNAAATGVTATLGGVGPRLVMVGLFLLTSGFTQVLSNTATTVLIAPIALAIARQMGVEPYAFLMTVAIAASMAFASPVASPVNTLVMGAGRYRFKDYIRVGLPMIGLTMTVALVALPWIWPF
jgi:di/tricarboxylate transporter